MSEEQALPDRDELLADLARARFDKSINVAAIKLLLEELRQDDADDSGTGFDALDEADELAARRKAS